MNRQKIEKDMKAFVDIIREFDWCENDTQKVGAMASEIRHLRENIRDLTDEINFIKFKKGVRQC